MADDSIAAAAIVQPSMTEMTEVRRSADSPAALTFADRAENAVQLLSRLAGVGAFVVAVTAILWLVF